MRRRLQAYVTAASAVLWLPTYLVFCFLVSVARAQQAPPRPSLNNPVQLVDITAPTGITFLHSSSPDAKYIVESMSGGVALLDFDGDGWLDIYFTNAPSVAMALRGEQARSALYRNNHDGTFTDVAEKAGVATPCWAMGATVGDYNNDGFPDLVVSCFEGVVLYRNNGNGTFTNVTRASHLDQDKGWATGVTFGDYDGDGNIDLFVPHYVDLRLDDLPRFGSVATCQYKGVPVQCGPRGLKGSPDALYHNNGDGTFSEVAARAGVSDPDHFFGLGASWSDFDGDGKLDLFVANDGESNYLFHNLGNGRFKEVALDAQVAVNEDGLEQANMGVALGDYDHSGRSSILVSHFSDEYAALYRNDGKLTFTDVSNAAGIAKASAPFVGWGDAFLDLDNSGWQDLVIVNGHVYPQVESTRTGITYKEPALVFANRRNGSFKDVTAASGAAIQLPQVARGLAVGDLFNTGQLDLVIENLVGSPRVLAARPDPLHHWISVALEGQPRNRSALNARVLVTTGAVRQSAEVRSGGSYLSQSDLRLHFGVGSATGIDKLEIDWPDGSVQSFAGVKTDQFFRVRQAGSMQPITYTHTSQHKGVSPQSIP